MNDPAEKYRDKVDPLHEIAMQSIGLARLVMNQHREHFEKFLEARRRMDSVGHILSPTLYRDVIHSQSLAQQIKLVEAAQAFLRATDEVVREFTGALSPQEGTRG
jgi:hypothetical protein